MYLTYKNKGLLSDLIMALCACRCLDNIQTAHPQNLPTDQSHPIISLFSAGPQ
jgi:hypothetical protein